jgi:hypothetical protein
MTEDSLYQITAGELFDLMAITADELLLLSNDHDGYLEKKKEMEMIQRVMVDRRAEFPPAK